MAENIKVAVRVRPFNTREKNLGSTCIVEMQDKTTKVDGKPFTYDYSYWSFDESQDFASQEIVWNDIGETILKSALDGFNGCLFAYGQTGSGKSYSVLGAPPPEPPGIVPRAVSRVFEEKAKLEQDDNVQICVWVSYLEIYQEHIHDLLCPKQDNPDLVVMQHPKLGVYVPNLTEEACSSPEKVQELMDFGTKRRAIAATQMNATSSRSHAVFCIKVERLEGPKPEKGANDTRHALTAKINLVDLAGSERQSKTGAEGSAFKEGCAINKSLSALGMVIKELSEAHGKVNGSNDHDHHSKIKDCSDAVPFRASKLTFLLKDSLAGNSRTYMIAAISPSSDNKDETISTLRFASSVKAIKTVAKQNKDKKDAIIDQLREELEQLRKGTGSLLAPNSAEFEERERVLQDMKKSFDHQIEQAKELEDLRKSVGGHGGLSQEEMTKMLGVEEHTPYLLNMAEDATMAGKLLYYLPVGKCSVIGSAEESDICLHGVGVSASLAKIENEDNHKLRISKCGAEGRVVHDGAMLKDTNPRELKHGQCLFLGRGIALKVVVPAMAEEEFAAHELLLHGLEEEWAAIDASPCMEKVEGFLSQVCQDLPGEAATALVREVRDVASDCDEANEITSALRPDEGYTFDITLTTSKPPHIVIHASQTTDQDGYKLVFICSPEQFKCRVQRMRDCHFVMGKRKEVHVEKIHNPWDEVNHEEIHHVVEQLRAKVEHLGGKAPLADTLRLDGVQTRSADRRMTMKAEAFAKTSEEAEVQLPSGSTLVLTPAVSTPSKAVREADSKEPPANITHEISSTSFSPRVVHQIDLTGCAYRTPGSPPVKFHTSSPATPVDSRFAIRSRFSLATQPLASGSMRSRVGSPGPSRHCRGRSVSVERAVSTIGSFTAAPYSSSGSVIVAPASRRAASLQVRVGPLAVRSTSVTPLSPRMSTTTILSSPKQAESPATKVGVLPIRSVSFPSASRPDVQSVPQLFLR